MKKWPTLYDLSSTGKVKVWMIKVESLYGEVSIITTHGYKDGKMSNKGKVIDKGKNIGKKNETTPYQQACFQAQSTYEKKLKKGYVDNEANIGSGFAYLPMLAKTYYQANHPDVVSNKKKETILSSPLVVQPKLNGVRCIAHKQDNMQVKLYSREGNEYTEVCSHIANDLSFMMNPGDIWDGEIYHHDISFQEIIRLVKKYRPGFTEKLQFHRYDIADENLTMMDRKWDMARLPVNDTIIQVETIVVNTNELKKWHDKWVQEGYEGLIIRLPDAKYRFKYRGGNLLKYKEFMDAEFRVVGYEQGQGNDRGTIKFKCRTTDHWEYGTDVYFVVRPRGSVEKRTKMYKRGWKYVGKMLTVRYQELSEEGKPIFPVGITVRDYE